MRTRPQHEASSEESAIISRRLSRRWKLLQVLGTALIALTGLIDWLHISDPTVPATPMFFLTLGIIVFTSGFALQRACAAGRAAN
jgi:lipid-A-disaccharide synthase-like uncharacterized protein